MVPQTKTAQRLVAPFFCAVETGFIVLRTMLVSKRSVGALVNFSPLRRSCAGARKNFLDGPCCVFGDERVWVIGGEL